MATSGLAGGTAARRWPGSFASATFDEPKSATLSGRRPMREPPQRSLVVVAGDLFVVGRTAGRATVGRFGNSNLCGGLESDPDEIEHIQQVSRRFTLLGEL